MCEKRQKKSVKKISKNSEKNQFFFTFFQKKSEKEVQKKSRHLGGLGTSKSWI